MIPLLATPFIAGAARFALSRSHKIINMYHQINEKIGPFGYGFLYAGGTVAGYHLNSSLWNKPFKYIGSPRRLSKL